MELEPLRHVKYSVFSHLKLFPSLLRVLHWELFRETLVKVAQCHFRDQVESEVLKETSFSARSQRARPAQGSSGAGRGCGGTNRALPGWEAAEPHLLGTGGPAAPLCLQIQPQEISPPPTANLDRSNDKVYENVTGLVKAVIEMSSKIQPAPPEEYVPMVKVWGQCLKSGFISSLNEVSKWCRRNFLESWK